MTTDISSAQDWVSQSGGLPVGNFAISASMSPTRGPCSTILKNPGRLGGWLEGLCKGSWSLQVDGTDFSWADLEPLEQRCHWPLSKVRMRTPGVKPLTLSVETFAPIAFDDEATSSLPVLCLEIEVSSSDASTQNVDLLWTLEDLNPPELLIEARGADDAVSMQGQLRMTLQMQGSNIRRVRVILSALDQDDLAARSFTHNAMLTNRVFHLWDIFREEVIALTQRIPDPHGLGNRLRAYMCSAVYLTRVTRRGEVLTMGYTDLNQRDSYWTSWAHLQLWPGLERRMIEASASAIKTDGKVPTCILAQRYERDDDLDINAYFVLRVLRYANHYADKELAYRLWPCVVAALRWLMARCPNGLPLQGSYWGDWKDVPGIEGRTHSPHACLVYLAALDKALAWGRRLCMPEVPELEAAYAAANKQINTPWAQGGLWNGNYYVQTWKDGREDPRLLQDQCVGILFNVIPPERAASIHEALADSRTPFGVRETWPYAAADFGYEPGCYHNGGIWPWLSFVDAWSRYRSGHVEEAIAIVRDVAHADLDLQGDGVPHEYLHSDTGENRGFPLQGWNASLFGFLTFLDQVVP